MSGLWRGSIACVVAVLLVLLSSAPIRAQVSNHAATAAVQTAAGKAPALLTRITTYCDATRAVVVEFDSPTDFAVFSGDDELVLSLPQAAQTVPELPAVADCEMLDAVYFRPALARIGGQLRLVAPAMVLASIDPVPAATPGHWALRIALSPAPPAAAAEVADESAPPESVQASLKAVARVQIKRVRIGERNGVTRVVLDLSAPLKYSVGRDAGALVVDLDEVEWLAENRRNWNSARLKSYRFDRGRLVIEGKRPLAWRRSFLLPPAGHYGHRLVLDTTDG